MVDDAKREECGRRCPGGDASRLVLAGVLAVSVSVVLAPLGARAQWRGLPDPPDAPDALPSQDAAPSARADGADVAPARPRPQPPRSRHELTVGVGPTLTTMVLRTSAPPGAHYRIALALREVSLQSSWTAFGAHMLGVRVAASAGVGRSVLKFTRPGFLDLAPGEDPRHLPGPDVGVDASLGLLVRAGPVRFGPQLVYSGKWLRDGAGQTVDVDVPYTTPRRIHALGIGILVQVRIHAHVALTVDTRALLQSRLPGGSLRILLEACWAAD